jgi:hypothetical protein
MSGEIKMGQIEQTELRQNGIITENEIAIVEGDILVAKNVLTLERRIIGKAEEILKENKNRRILKG